MKNEHAAAQGLPAWLDGRTVAVIGTVLTVGIGVAGTGLGSTSALRSDMNTRFQEVNTRFQEVNTRIDGLDSRLRGVEVGIAEIRGHLGLLGPDPRRVPDAAASGAARGSMPATPDAHGGGPALAHR